MNTYESFFVIHFIIILLIFFIKLYNIMTHKEFKTIIPFDISIMWLIGSVIDFGVGLVIFLLSQPNQLIASLFFVSVAMFALTFILFIAEVGFNMARIAVDLKPTEAHYSRGK